MSLLVELAARADVPLEAVVRVLTREPVNEDHKGRVLAVLDHLDAEETRVLQRFALAAVHDALPTAGFEGLDRRDHEDVVAELVDDPLELPEAVRLELGPGPAPAPAQELATAEGTASVPQAVDPAPLVQLSSVLGELTEAVRELRQETDAERRERVDDLAVLIDLITKGWQGVDRRLGRVERQLGRLEASPPQREVSARIEPPPVPTPPEPPAPTPDGGGDDDADAERRSTLRQRLPLLAALAFGIGIGAAAALDLPSRIDASRVSSDRSTAEAAERVPLPGTVAERVPEEPTTTAGPQPEKQPSSPPVRPRTPPATAPTLPPPTSGGPPTRAERMTTAPTSSARGTTQAPATTAAPGVQSPSAFTPSRNWAWPPSEGAEYYLVEFFRDGELLYRARPREARLTLPRSVTFAPGRYRWRVRPGEGPPSANRLGDPIVDSEFVLRRG